METGCCINEYSLSSYDDKFNETSAFYTHRLITVVYKENIADFWKHQIRNQHVVLPAILSLEGSGDPTIFDICHR